MNVCERTDPWKFLNALLKNYSLEELRKMGFNIPETGNHYQYLCEHYLHSEALAKYNEYQSRYMENYIAGDEAINARNKKYVYISEFSDDSFLAYFLGMDSRIYLFDKSNMKKTGKTYGDICEIIKQLGYANEDKEETA